MLEAISSSFLFLFSLALAVFLPGYFLLETVFEKKQFLLHPLEKFILSSGVGIISLDFIFLIFPKIHLPITRFSSASAIIFFLFLCILISRGKILFFFSKKSSSITQKNNPLFDFSKKQSLALILILFLTILIRLAYLSDTAHPTATDMGHHMYWAKWMVENKTLPTYEGMPDFIIGEHIVFGITHLLSGADFFSAFPFLLLLVINIFSILTVFILTLRIFKEPNLAIATLFFLGILYAVNSPQAKFISGGVIGNLLGNLLLPTVFYFYYRALSFFDKNTFSSKKSSSLFFGMAIFSTFGLFYTHHLSAFIFLFIFFLLALFFSILNFTRLKNIWGEIFSLVFTPFVLNVFLFGIVFFFFVFTPTYIAGQAVSTAVGTPSKETRAGLTLAELSASVGEARIAFGLIGTILLAWLLRKKELGATLIFSWTIAIFVMSTFPHLLFINLPSNRIGNYLSYPLAITSAYAVFFIFSASRKIQRKPFILIGLILLLTFAFTDGLRDSAKAFKKKEDLSPIAQTFNASSYLVQKISATDIILKDHNYITADSWIKLFFMQGYKYPLSRGYFKRYEDKTKPRESCTLQMIATPSSSEAISCFKETGTNFILVDPNYDSAQFEKLDNFDLVYSASKINIYHRN